MTTQSTITVTDQDILTADAFAAITETAFAGAAILPNADVWAAASRLTRRGEAEISLVADDDRCSVYRIARPGAKRCLACLLIFQEDNRTVDLHEIACDEEDHENWATAMPELAGLLAELDS